MPHAIPQLPSPERQSESGQMSSKTILIGLGIFRCGGEITNPFMEDLPGSSLRTTVVRKKLKFLARDVNLCRRNAASMIGLESADWFDLQHNFFILDKAKALPIRTGSQTA